MNEPQIEHILVRTTWKTAKKSARYKLFVKSFIWPEFRSSPKSELLRMQRVITSKIKCMPLNCGCCSDKSIFSSQSSVVIILENFYLPLLFMHERNKCSFKSNGMSRTIFHFSNLIVRCTTSCRTFIHARFMRSQKLVSHTFAKIKEKKRTSTTTTATCAIANQSTECYIRVEKLPRNGTIHFSTKTRNTMVALWIH